MNEPNNKTHKLIWIKVTNETADKIDKLAQGWSLTRASLCRLIVLEFLNQENPNITITKNNAE